MKYLLTIILTLTILTAQEGQVTNVVAEQRTDGSHIVDITYDLLPDSEFPSFTVFAYISIDGGETFESLDINNSMFPNVLGDNVLPDNDKSFYWDHVQDYQSISSDNIIFKISAYGHEATILPDSFEMAQVPSGDYMGYYYAYSSNSSNLVIDDGFDSLMTVGYDYEIMKYPVTNAQFCTFLLELLDQNLITGPSGNVVDYDYSESVNPYPVPNPPWSYYADAILVVTSEPSQFNGRIYWNGETYLVEEGYADHPVQRVYTCGMELFAEYYGLRLPTMHEYIKAFRGMENYDYINRTYHEDAPDASYLDGNFNAIFNFMESGDPWEDYGDNRNTTPVNFYNGTIYGDFETLDFPSEYGVYDMHGNIREIVTVEAVCYQSAYSICWDETGEIKLRNSIGATTMYPYYVQRSSFESSGGWGSWSNGYSSIHSWNHYELPDGENRLIGFRCARTLNSNNE